MFNSSNFIFRLPLPSSNSHLKGILSNFLFDPVMHDSFSCSRNSWIPDAPVLLPTRQIKSWIHMVLPFKLTVLVCKHRGWRGLRKYNYFFMIISMKGMWNAMRSSLGKCLLRKQWETAVYTPSYKTNTQWKACTSRILIQHVLTKKFKLEI